MTTIECKIMECIYNKHSEDDKYGICDITILRLKDGKCPYTYPVALYPKPEDTT